MGFIQVTDVQADKVLVNTDAIVMVRPDDASTDGASIETTTGQEIRTQESFRSVKGYVLKATGQRGAMVKSEGETE